MSNDSLNVYLTTGLVTVSKRKTQERVFPQIKKHRRYSQLKIKLLSPMRVLFFSPSWSRAKLNLYSSSQTVTPPLQHPSPSLRRRHCISCTVSAALPLSFLSLPFSLTTWNSRFAAFTTPTPISSLWDSQTLHVNEKHMVYTPLQTHTLLSLPLYRSPM